jgi:hypothetical protein
MHVCRYVRTYTPTVPGQSVYCCVIFFTVGTGRGDGDGVSSANKLQSVDENEESRILHYTLTIYKLIS